MRKLNKSKEKIRLMLLAFGNAIEERRRTTLELSDALDAETQTLKTITDLVNKNRSLRADIRRCLKS